MPERDPSPSRKPELTAPVSRYLDVSDPTRSRAFYESVLGFEVGDVQEGAEPRHVVELVNGAARLWLQSAADIGNAAGARRAAGSAVVFLQTNDIAGMREAIATRGGDPTPLEDVNWLKLRVFQVRDPDGNTLWFGQSLDELRSGQPAVDNRSRLRQIMPELPLDDVPTGVAHYQDVLGFRVNYQQHDLGVMDRDGVRLLLIARTEQHQGIGSCYLYVSDADALHGELHAKGANVLGEPVSQPWGLREFQVLDLAGNRLTFGQPFE